MMRIIESMLVALVVTAGLTGCASQQNDGAAQRVAITVTDEGFTPNRVTVRSGEPVVLVVTRTSDRTCATELVLKDYGINQKLPLNKAVEIEFTPQSTGDLTYACAMDMYKGHVVVQ